VHEGLKGHGFSPQRHDGTEFHGDFFIIEGTEDTEGRVYWFKRHGGYKGTIEINQVSPQGP
jgi:hypothetical protein